ncbi:hypothetical protein AKJ39_04635 [candidate division MSBL1 archaeon SCGC-AAA259J03]|uniref:Type II secretion system protein GspF domain-containing protein n=1 Tax=candidate division MSBL1 archaeon SCGC-AAA259J03 TaxID=1698269 RepID=A0A656YUQ7_9EURY|nr:hypothetical protein AKJ39_04635 [candidate division MSBL1 archaeon SCGC-AAA259J03]
MVSILESMEKFAEKVLPESFTKNVDRKLRSTHIAFSGTEFSGVSLLAGIDVGIAIFIISLFVPFPFLPGPLYAVIGFAATFLILTQVIPFFLIERRVNEIEDHLPDALRQMSNILRAGVSMDRALEDVSQSDYGALSEEFEYTINQVRRGRPMRDALEALAARSRSDLLKRAFFLIVEGMERGAELADVMEAVGDDIRETQILQRERQSATMQQILFLIAVAIFVAPLLSGLVLSIGTTFEEIGAEAAAGTGMGGAVPPLIYTVVPIFIVIQAFITSLAVSVIRYGDLPRGLMFAGPFMIAAIAVFYGSKIFAGFLM